MNKHKKKKKNSGVAPRAQQTQRILTPLRFAHSTEKPCTILCASILSCPHLMGYYTAVYPPLLQKQQQSRLGYSYIAAVDQTLYVKKKSTAAVSIGET